MLLMQKPRLEEPVRDTELSSCLLAPAGRVGLCRTCGWRGAQQSNPKRNYLCRECTRSIGTSTGAPSLLQPFQPVCRVSHLSVWLATVPHCVDLDTTHHKPLQREWPSAVPRTLRSLKCSFAADRQTEGSLDIASIWAIVRAHAPGAEPQDGWKNRRSRLRTRVRRKVLRRRKLLGELMEPDHVPGRVAGWELNQRGGIAIQHHNHR